ncbi:pyridoxamine 5'-phosphate oxidase family protein [Streptomyces millisiae]|uniref:Pyridoxamine 5'-phosphate oxidase family protein n=1 Tax=Streptomyces millisiae TaxID=3075542 RepID=A0ABU2LM42_9ACTN|nr:pyridoxamine 5'-phosphate oxidase family protein [Streptomyces sp. DSM 44918]MDT0318654.1 pyridoxamine 5'-phosphate oxidase family protein [Streptomyces sp. DSM 44918]
MPAAGSGRGDVGRRLAARRERLGLTPDDVAERAGVAASYVRYAERRPDAPDTAALLRLAAALDTSAAELLGGGSELPPGLGEAGPRPELVPMSGAECREHLATHGVGRVAVPTPEGPAIFPVNYTVADDAIVFRTGEDSPAARAAGAEVAFEVDHVDDALSRGWSVLVTGPSRQVTDPAEVSRLDEAARSQPWAGGERRRWVRITTARVTGRRIRTG